MKKKILKVICWILVALVLLVPIPVHYKDGGTVSYNAILYSVTKVHSITSSRYSDDGELEVGYAIGTRVRVLIFPVYDDVKEVYPE